MIEWITNVNNAVNSVVWGVPALVMLIGTGILVTVISRFFQFRRFGHMWHETMGKLFKKSTVKSSDKNSISQFQALCTALSATIGTGNITGVAVAITMGGPGAIFWMWVAALVGMMTNFTENVLGIYFRRRNNEKEWCGGAMYYLRDGLGRIEGYEWVGKILAVLFSIFAIMASFGIGNMGQISSIRESVLTVAGSITGNADLVNSTLWSIVIGVILAAIAGLVIIGGLHRIAETNERIVPFMAIFYIVGAVIIVGMNYQNIGAAFGAIFSQAFTGSAAAGGGLGIAVTWGLKRGVFSNEAGLGSSVMVHSTSDVKEPVTQGLWGIFEVFVDTIIVCTLTALVILTAGIVDLNTGASLNGTAKLALATEAFTGHFGTFGGIFTAIAVTLFAFSTCLGWSFYGKKSWEFLFGNKSTMIYKVVFVAAIVASCVLDTGLAIDLSDTFNGLMSIPNLIGVVALSPVMVKLIRNYTARRIKGDHSVKPMLSAFEDVQAEQEIGLYDGEQSKKDKKNV